MIARIKSPSRDKPHFLCLELPSEQTRINNLIDQCFQLNVADKKWLKTKYNEKDSTLLRIFEKHGKAACSLKLQIQLRKYLSNSTNRSESKLLRDKIISRQKSVRFKVPANMQHSSSIKKQIVRNKSRSSPGRKESISPKKPLQITQINSPAKPQTTSSLFSSTKNRLKFKNELKQLQEPIQSQLLIPNKDQYSPINKIKTCPSMDLKSKPTVSTLHIQSTPPTAVTGFNLLSPRLIKVMTESLNESMEESSIDIKQPTIDNSFKIFEMNNYHIDSDPDEYSEFLKKLKESYAEDIFSIFFKPFGRHILKDQFIQEIISNLTQNKEIAQVFADNLFKHNLTLSPSMLGNYLELYCSQKQTKTRTIFNRINNQQKQDLSMADIYNFFTKFPEEIMRQFKELFQQDLQMLVLDSGQNLTYWDLYIMQQSRCWTELWKYLMAQSIPI